MSVVTKRGDFGETDLMYGHRVSKTHPRVVANGALDELNAQLGLVRWHARQEGAEALSVCLAQCQNELIHLMGLIATLPEDRARYRKDGFPDLHGTAVEVWTERAHVLERTLQKRFKDWAIPGESDSLGCAHLEVARTQCRRAERAVLNIPQSEDSLGEPIRYLNRLADFLWLASRAWERHLDFLAVSQIGVSDASSPSQDAPDDASPESPKA